MSICPSHIDTSLFLLLVQHWHRHHFLLNMIIVSFNQYIRKYFIFKLLPHLDWFQLHCFFAHAHRATISLISILHIVIVEWWYSKHQGMFKVFFEEWFLCINVLLMLLGRKVIARSCKNKIMCSVFLVNLVHIDINLKCFMMKIAWHGSRLYTVDELCGRDFIIKIYWRNIQTISY